MLTSIPLATLEDYKIPAQEVSKGVFKIETQYGATMYYPKHSKWIHRGKTREGDLQAFSQWVRPLLITGD